MGSFEDYMAARNAIAGEIGELIDARRRLLRRSGRGRVLPRDPRIDSAHARLWGLYRTWQSDRAET